MNTPAEDALLLGRLAREVVETVMLENGEKYPERDWVRLSENNHMDHIISHLIWDEVNDLAEVSDTDLAHALTRLTMIIYLRANPQ